MTRIPITRPVFGEEELRAVQLPLESEWVVQGRYVREFEELFAAYVGSAEAIATTSCTTALHIAVAALGLQPGDEVIVPAFTWVSTANVVEYLGARPIFCDVDPATFNIDVDCCAALIGDRTVGIIPVHLFGLPARVDPLCELAEAHGLWILEDAACGLGARHDGRHVGTFGAAGAFSFHPRKSITTGEGGMLVTDDAEVARLARSLRDHGASRSDFDRHHASGSFLLPEYPYLGFNFRMTDIQASLGCAQMARVDWILGRRRELAARYDALLEDLPWLRPPAVPAGDVHGYQAYVRLFAADELPAGDLAALSERRNRVMTMLENEGIATRQGTHAPVTTRYYADKYGLRPDDFPGATTAEALTLTLPLYPQLTDDDQRAVVAALERATVACGLPG